jgi:hypothetical protein
MWKYKMWLKRKGMKETFDEKEKIYIKEKMHTHRHVFMCVHIYIYKERGRERGEREIHR